MGQSQPEKGGGRLRTLFPPDTLVDPTETLWNVTDEQLNSARGDSSMVDEWQQYWDQNTHPFLHSHTIHKLSKEFVPVRFLHLYSDIPIRTNLLCHLLSTPKACQASVVEDAMGASELAHLNDGTLYMDRIWYDQLATAAVDRHLVPAHVMSRGKLTEACRHFHQQQRMRLNRTSTRFDLPHKCPHPQALLALWDVSWNMEQAMLGHRHANRTLHAEIFRRNLATGKYCNLDATRAIQQTEWQTFFHGLASKGQI